MTSWCSFFWNIFNKLQKYCSFSMLTIFFKYLVHNMPKIPMECPWLLHKCWLNNLRNVVGFWKIKIKNSTAIVNKSWFIEAMINLYAIHICSYYKESHFSLEITVMWYFVIERQCKPRPFKTTSFNCYALFFVKNNSLYKGMFFFMKLIFILL